jgi:hypothetical protein
MWKVVQRYASSLQTDDDSVSLPVTNQHAQLLVAQEKSKQELLKDMGERTHHVLAGFVAVPSTACRPSWGRVKGAAA